MWGFRVNQCNIYTLTTIQCNPHKWYIYLQTSYISNNLYKWIIHVQLEIKPQKLKNLQVVLYWLSLTYTFINAMV